MVVKRMIYALLGLLPALLLVTVPKPAESRQLIDYNRNLCHSVARAMERANGIPTDLLTAISLTETGRWDKEKKEMFAWPWTVTSGGPGSYYRSKAEAIAAVKALQAKGVTNIDVGCMQINLRYHPNAFEDLDQAFNPQDNIGYATKFMAELHKITGSWTQAAANYHSMNPELNIPYMEKVTRLWEGVSGKDAKDLPTHPSPQIAYRDPTRRVAQMELLNSRFKARLAAERGTKRSVKARQQLADWREQRSSANLLEHNAALKRALRLKRQRDELLPKKSDFAAKRRAQLAAWRKDKYVRRN